MRDFRDAKAMAQTLRTSLTAKAVTISHSESLELVSKMFGVADWNTLSAQIQAGREEPVAPATRLVTLAGRYPAIPLRDLVPFPGAIIPLFAGRAKTIQALDLASRHQRQIVIAIQRSSIVDEPSLPDVYDIGVLAGILDLEQLGDGTVKVLTQIYRRVAITGFASDARGYLAAVEEISAGPILDAPDLIRTAMARFRTYAERQNLPLPADFQLRSLNQLVARLPQPAPPQPLEKILDPDLFAGAFVRQIRDPGRVADIIAANIELPIPDKQVLLATLDPVARLERVDALLLADQEGS
jgi:ATP-dependent Lon protease